MGTATKPALWPPPLLRTPTRARARGVGVTPSRPISSETDMEFFEVLRRRRSIREFTDESVDDAALESLFDDAVQAPSATNRQPWSFVIITNRELIDRYDTETRASYLDGATAPLQDAPEELLEHLRGVIGAPGYRIFHCARPSSSCSRPPTTLVRQETAFSRPRTSCLPRARGDSAHVRSAWHCRCSTAATSRPS